MFTNTYDLNRPGFGILTVGNSYISLVVFRLPVCRVASVATDSSVYGRISCMESVEKYFKGKLHKSEPQPRTANYVNTVHFRSSGGIFESVARILFKR